ncbi:DNA cytosine methyltransferase [Methanimicrococcus sp. OttesenSCG-928-J09]|nr:DNA cytosine methyltransferase [Methanimicrococcus sp. OttesenSCG-928-J09]
MAITHLELFAGIGGFRQALDLLCNDFNLQSENIGYSEIDANAINTYKANFDTSKEVEIGDIVSFVHDKSNIEDLPDFNFLSGGFPCQSFSMMGKQNGFEDVRGNVFFQILEIIKTKKPKFILLENVKNIITHNKGKTFETILNSIEDAGYNNIYYDVFNTHDFSLAQNRNRVYIFATTENLNPDFKFSSKEIANIFHNIKLQTSLVQHTHTYDILEKNVDEKYYLSEVIKPTILADGSKKFQSKSTIDQLVARPLTATMAKMHRACQDNYFSDDFLYSDNKKEYSKLIFSKDELAKKNIRRLTPKEAFLLQGFSNTFYDNAKKVGTSDSQLYKQAGNAVSVNTVYAILYYILIERNIFGE